MTRTLAEAKLPLSLQVWDDGTISLLDSAGYFILSVDLDQLQAVAKLVAESEPWLGQPIPRAPA
jgi:hypothetical protein